MKSIFVSFILLTTYFAMAGEGAAKTTFTKKELYWEAQCSPQKGFRLGGMGFNAFRRYANLDAVSGTITKAVVVHGQVVEIEGIASGSNCLKDSETGLYKWTRVSLKENENIKVMINSRFNKYLDVELDQNFHFKLQGEVTIEKFFGSGTAQKIKDAETLKDLKFSLVFQLTGRQSHEALQAGPAFIEYTYDLDASQKESDVISFQKK